MFMKNGLVPDASFLLNGKNISECSSYVYLCRKVNMMNDLAPDKRTSAMPLITARNRRSGVPVMLCDIVMTVGAGRLLTGSLGTSNELQDDRQRDEQTSSRKL
ncbi:hypothetical protein V3C99_005377 [Haemonchus contortus]|uniref:Uncharacterized protein n=1 Tax=Haemonchus contortus TaxID=6289 RepID=A0A7I4XUV8_HAECO